MQKIPDDIAKIKSSIKKLKSIEKTEQESHVTNSYSVASSLGFQISVELLAGTIVGGSIGYFLDDLFDFKPFLLIIFLLLGGAAGFLNAYRTAKNFEANNKE